MKGCSWCSNWKNSVCLGFDRRAPPSQTRHDDRNGTSNGRPTRFSNKRSRSRSPPARPSRFDNRDSNSSYNYSSHNNDYKRLRTDHSRPSHVMQRSVLQRTSVESISVCSRTIHHVTVIHPRAMVISMHIPKLQLLRPMPILTLHFTITLLRFLHHRSIQVLIRCIHHHLRHHRRWQQLPHRPCHRLNLHLLFLQVHHPRKFSFDQKDYLFSLLIQFDCAFIYRLLSSFLLCSMDSREKKAN